jgi:hypothetical protein
MCRTLGLRPLVIAVLRARIVIFGALAIVLTTMPAWCAKPITVGQLEDMVRSLQQAGKPDVEVATALKQVELTEQLTPDRMNGLISRVPGMQSTAQIFILEGRAADLIPPPSELPNLPQPSPDLQQGMLGKADAWIAGTYDKLPKLSASVTTLRLQDNVEAIAGASGLQGGAQDVVTSSGLSKTATFMHYINSTQKQVAFEHGAEQFQPDKIKMAWGANGMIDIQKQPPSLTLIFKEAKTSGSLHWARWQHVYGKAVAVFTFSVLRKASGLELNVCCFPSVKQFGVATFYTALTGPVLAPDQPTAKGAASGGAEGNLQTSTEWKNYKAIVPYHGEIFVDAESSIVLRMVVEAETAQTDVVHQQSVRIDYGPVAVGGKVSMLPVRTVINSEVVVNGESGAGGYRLRHTLFTAEYRDYSTEK